MSQGLPGGLPPGEESRRRPDQVPDPVTLDRLLNGDLRLSTHLLQGDRPIGAAEAALIHLSTSRSVLPPLMKETDSP